MSRPARSAARCQPIDNNATIAVLATKLARTNLNNLGPITNANIRPASVARMRELFATWRGSRDRSRQGDDYTAVLGIDPESSGK